MTLPALLVANENSRRGREVAPFVAALEAGGLAIRREHCGEREALGKLILALRAEVGSVILAGGDGTMNAAAAALRESGLPLGILPLGTANDLARTLGVPAGAAEAARVILAGRTREVDLGCANDRPYFNVASLGLSVDITHRLSALMKRRLGVFAYPVAAAAVIVRAGRFHARMVVDGAEHRVRTMQIAVGNGHFYGGGMVVDESAAIDDDRLHVYSLEPRARWRLLVMARAFRAGQHHKLREVRNLTCRSLLVETRHPRPVSADGEIVTQTPARFTLLPKAVRVFVP